MIFDEPGRVAHLYALLAWSNKYTANTAKAEVALKDYESLDGLTYAETSINAAVKGMNAKFFQGKEITATSKTCPQIEPTEANYDKVVEIIADIHNKWVNENAKKYDRGSVEKSNKKLFQHLPTAFIGLDEVAKDLMFLAPILEMSGLNPGEMELAPYGAYKPSREITAAYERFVEKTKTSRNINSKEDLRRVVNNCLHGSYPYLLAFPAEDTEVKDNKKARLAYMRDHLIYLLNQL